jgi:predicted RNA-binding Zn ribbon-like protein
MSTDQGAEPLAIEFANTCRARRGVPVELLVDDTTLAGWIRTALGRDLAGRLAPGDRERFLGLRDAVRAVAAAISSEQPEPGVEVAQLNAAAASAPTWPELIDGRRIERTAATEVNATLAALAASAIEVFGGQQRDQVRACGRWPLCVRFFVRNHPRRGYCSPQCANRARAMRHHDRHRDDG